MKRISALAALGAFALAGCGGGSSSSSTSSLSTVKEPRTERLPTSSTTSTGESESTSTPTASGTTAKPVLPNNASPAQTVTVALTSGDTAVCELYTPKLLDRSFGGVEGCRSSIRSGGRAGSVEIVNANAKKDQALVVAVPHGGPSSAQKLQITLVRSGKRWQLASLRSNVPVGP